MSKELGVIKLRDRLTAAAQACSGAAVNVLAIVRDRDALVTLSVEAARVDEARPALLEDEVLDDLVEALGLVLAAAGDHPNHMQLSEAVVEYLQERGRL